MSSSVHFFSLCCYLAIYVIQNFILNNIYFFTTILKNFNNVTSEQDVTEKSDTE